MRPDKKHYSEAKKSVLGAQLLLLICRTNSLLSRWLTDCGEVNMKRVEIMMKGLGDVEDEIFRRRKAKDDQFKRNRKRTPRKGQFMPQKYAYVAPFDKPAPTSAEEFKERRRNERMNNVACNEAEQKLKTLLQITSEPVSDSGKVEESSPWQNFKRPHEADRSGPPEKVCLEKIVGTPSL